MPGPAVYDTIVQRLNLTGSVDIIAILNYGRHVSPNRLTLL